jgi:hypothetical protein
MQKIKNRTTGFSIDIGNRRWSYDDFRRISDQKGSILIGLIVTMVIMAALGAGMVYLTTTSTYQELFANNHVRAYYAAESGGRYASAIARKALATGVPDIDDVPGDYFSNYYTLANGDKFEISNWTDYETSGSKFILFDSIGTSGTGFLQAKRKLSYRINPANQMAGTGGGPTGPDNVFPDDAPSTFEVPKEDLDIYYSPVDMNEVDIKDNPKVDNDRALNLKADDYTMGLRWYADLTFAQLDDIRHNNNDLLSYGVQVQIKDIDVDSVNASPWGMVGISFRLDDRNDATTSDDLDNMYGISFVKFIKPGNVGANDPVWYKLYIHTNSAWNYFSVDNAGDWYVVLWKRIYSGTTPTYSPLAYQKISYTDSVCRAGDANGCTKIDYWATIIVYIVEKSDATNEITAYTSQPPEYARSIVNETTGVLSPGVDWAHDYETGEPDPTKVPTKFKPISWTVVTGSGASKQSTSFAGIANPIDKIIDGSLTTANYSGYTLGNTAQTKAREIGLHIFNKSTSAQNIYYDNFFIDLSPSSTGGGLIDGTGQIDIGG